MKPFFKKLFLVMYTIHFAACSVDYSILEDRYCNTSNECLKGYRCDLSTRKCIKGEITDVGMDIDTQDIKILDIDHRDITDAYYDIKDISDEHDIELSDITGTDDSESNPDIISDTSPDASQCITGTYSCQIKDLYKCNENNQWVFEKTCDIDCINDHCAECPVGEKICEDETNIKICSKEGLYQIEKCDYKCYNNQCVICTPQDRYCQDKTAVVCNPTGTQWDKTDCQIGCSEGDCMICQPSSSYQCKDNDLYICAPNGLEYTFLMNCCHENNCSENGCVKTGPRVLDYNPKDWKVFSTVIFTIDGCFFVKDASRVLIDYGGSWKEITAYNNFKYKLRLENRIQIEVDVQTASEYNFKVQNPDGQESGAYPIKKHY